MVKPMRKRKGETYYTNGHSYFMMTCHIVLVTKFRRPVLTGPVRETVYRIIRDTLESRDCHVLQMNGEPDHVHILIEYSPAVCIADLVNVIKTRSARRARTDHSEDVSEYYWKPYFWGDGYFAASVGLNTASVVEEYIRNQ